MAPSHSADPRRTTASGPPRSHRFATPRVVAVSPHASAHVLAQRSLEQSAARRAA